MIAKWYRYTLSTVDREQWERITTEATECYRAHGMIRGEVFVQETAGMLNVVEINYYSSPEHMEQVIQEVDRDSRIAKLFQEFLKIVPQDSITEEVYQVIE
jgi:hypothetical protein